MVAVSRKATRSASPLASGRCARALRPYRVVAFARGALKSPAVKNTDLAPGIVDQATAAEASGSYGDRTATHAEHVGQKFVSEMEMICMGPVMGQQQPAC